MHYFPPGMSEDELRLSQLASQFRSNRQEAARQAIARDYAATVYRLIDSGTWAKVPTFEDQLPDDWMPKAFFAWRKCLPLKTNFPTTGCPKRSLHTGLTSRIRSEVACHS
jgi:hypothetical protein